MNGIKMREEPIPYWSLFAIYFVLFFASTVTNIKSTEFMGWMRGRLVQAINGMFEHPYYNMMAWYHSRVYGWSYIALTAVFLAPLKKSST